MQGMTSNQKNNDKEAQLHDIFNSLMELFDRDPEADLTPKIDDIEPFPALYGFQGCTSWLRMYELDPWELIRILFCGSEAAFGLSPLPEMPTSEKVTQLLDGFSKAVDDPKLVSPELIDDSVKLKAVQLVLASRCLRVGYVCLLQYKVSISTLIQNAREGDVDSFLCLVRLDSTFLYTKYGRAIVLEAELRNDFEFKMDLADALEPDPKFCSLIGKRNHYMFLTLWMLGDYANRSDNDWADFFALEDIETYSDTTNVRMQRKRYNLSRPTLD